MSDARARAVERAHAAAADPAADEARRIAEHLRAGGRDPRWDPRQGDVVEGAVHGDSRTVYGIGSSSRGETYLVWWRRDLLHGSDTPEQWRRWAKGGTVLALGRA